jgi:serine beta-lactamase-like protein LACTB
MQIQESLHRTILEVHEKQENVGLAVVILHQGELFYSDYTGLADLEHKVPVNADSRFGIASVTKLFTAVALLKLNADSKVDLDTPVQQYMPDFPKKSDKDITIRMLATHQSGIPHPAKRTPKLFATHYKRATEAIEVFRNDPLLFEPGSNTEYSSSNYNLIAAVIENATGQPFTEVVTESILRLLNLASSSFENVLRPVSDLARRYSFYHPWTYEESETVYVVPTWDYSFNMGGGNIISTATDIAKFGSALCQPGLLPEQQLCVLSTESWFGASYQDHPLIYATGGNPGVQAGLAIHQKEQLVTVILSNTYGKGSRSGEMAELAKVLSVEVLEESAR